MKRIVYQTDFKHKTLSTIFFICALQVHAECENPSVISILISSWDPFTREPLNVFSLDHDAYVILKIFHWLYNQYLWLLGVK